MRRAVFAGVIGAVVAVGVIVRSAPRPEVALEPARAELWTAAGAVADLSGGGGRVWLASAGGLVSLEGGQVRERLRQPEIAWRGVGARGEDVAAVALRHVTWLHAGRWRSAALPEGVEGFAIAADAKGWWVGHSSGLQRLDPAAGLGKLERKGDPVRSLASDGESSFALTRDRLQRVGGPAVELPEGVRGPWSLTVHEGAPLLTGAASDQPLTVWKWSGKWHALPAVPGRGSHVTALAAGSGLLAAVAGDGWWQLRDRQWQRFPGSLPDPLARDTAAVGWNRGGWIGAARSGGVWRSSGGRWASIPLPSELPSANIQAVAEYQGAIYASTFDRGLLVQSGSRWLELGTGGAPKYPRQLAVAAGKLFVREADGTLSAFDGQAWERNLLRHKLKRSWIGALIPHEDGLALGGWGTVVTGLPGAWKETHLPAPWDQVGLTALAGSGSRLAAGTGKNGVLLVDLDSGKATHAAGGPADPWVTTLAAQDSRLTVGTASGQVGHLGGAYEDLIAPVTAVTVLPDGSEVAATRDAVYRRSGGKWIRIECPFLDALEPQCLRFTGDALWVGGRHGLVRVPVAQHDGS